MSQNRRNARRHSNNRKPSDIKKEQQQSNAIQNRQGYKSNPEAEKEFKGVGLNSAGRDNDPAWYFTSPELAEQASQLSFQNVMGLGSVINYEVPTFAVYKMAPSPGNSYGVTQKSATPGAVSNVPSNPDLNSGINITSAKTFSLLSTFSGRAATAYMPGDVAVMELAIASIAEWSEYCRRFFGLIMTTNDRNRFLPYGIIDAMGVDPADLRANLANYRMRFNVAISRINQIPLLDNIGFIRKARDLYQKVYMDSMSSMAQYIAMIPDGYWLLDETGSAGGTRLIYVDNAINGAGHTMDSKLRALETMIDQMLGSSTLNIVYADLLNLANKVKVATWQFDYLSENYVVLPEYNRNFLLQVHNLDIVGKPIDFSLKTAPVSITSYGFDLTSGNYVFQDVNKNAVIYNPCFKTAVPFTASDTSTNNGSYAGTIIDMDTSTPTTEDRIEALRFSILRSGYVFKTANTDINYSLPMDVFVALPDHYCTALYISDNTPNTSMAYDSNYYKNAANVNPGNLVNSITKFDWSPHFYGVDTTVPMQNNDVVGDLNFFTEIDYNYMARLNRLITVGLFDFRV